MIKTLPLCLLVLAITCCAPKRDEVAGGTGPEDIIPVPVEYYVLPGSIRTDEMTKLPEKIRISDKAILRRLKGKELADWQLKSTYWLEVGKKGVKIEAADPEGVFYARQSLKMLASLGSSVACCAILDWPRFRYRGILLDESRHFQGKDFVMKQLEMMALLKMNRFHFHLVDNPGWRIQIEAYPRLTQKTAWRPQAEFWDWEVDEIGGEFVGEETPGAYGGYYTKQDIAEILAFADERHIEVIPEIEMPGHNYETRAAYPELACSLPEANRPDHWELCPGKESTYEFLEKVLLEVFEMFPGDYIHIGGDEAGKRNWERCPDCQARMKAEGLKSVEELQSYMIRRMERFANEHGKRIIGWDEILEGGLAPDATVMSWHGTQGGIQAIAEGHDVIFTPTHYYYLDYHQDPNQYRPVGRYLPLEKVYSFDPLEEGISEADAHHVLGVQGNLWTEWVREAWHAETMLYPRAFAIAETGWSPAYRKDYPDFERRATAFAAVARKMGYNVYGLQKFIPAAGHDNGWQKRGEGPVLGSPELGTCFDVNVIPDGSAKYNMYFSWRPKKAIALSRSEDGFTWTDPKIVLEYDESSGWEDDLNRSCTLFLHGVYHMWYTGQARGYSKIGYAVSYDGESFERVTTDPVMVPEFNYEGYSVMNPYVLYDEDRGMFRMWYACGETYEPNMIAYAESKDGVNWVRSPLNPIFVKGEGWEQDRIGGCEIHELPDGRFIMFYIGYSDINTARIGAAISPDGIRQWKRLETNPLVEPTEGCFDASACYKPSVFRDEENGRWQLWYNGRNGGEEYIGYAVHEGLELE